MESGERRKLDLDDLPVLPTTLVEIIRVIEKGDDSEVEELAAVIDRDPPLAVKIRSYVNSAFVGRRVKAKDTVEAIKTMGFNKVWPIALTMNFYEFLSGGTRAFDPRRFWKHSVQVAIASVRIAEKAGFADLGSAFFCGLVHDIGILVLERNFPDQVEAAWKGLRSEDELAEREYEQTGWDHMEAGALYLEDRGFPAWVRSVVKGHHHPSLGGGREKEGMLNRIVNLAHMISHYTIEEGRARHLEGTALVERICAECGIGRRDLLALEALLIPETIRQCKYLDKDIGSLEKIMEDVRAALYQGCMGMADELQRRFGQLRPKLDGTLFKTALDRAVRTFCRSGLNVEEVEGKLREIAQEEAARASGLEVNLLNEFMADRYRAMQEMLEMDPRTMIRIFGGPGPAEKTEPEEEPAGPSASSSSYEIPVFYATDRSLRDSTRVEQVFSGRPSAEDDLHYGLARVSVPDQAPKDPGSVNPLWRHLPGESLFCNLEGLFRGDRERFTWALDGLLEPAPRRRAMLFVHGYNATFDQAVRLAARLAYEVDYPGVPLLFSWPSAGTFFGYGDDEERVVASRERLLALLRLLLATGEGLSLDLVACGMGGSLLAGALAALELEESPATAGRLGQVVFVAPDVEEGLFRRLALRFRRKAERVTLYASSLDWSLLTSRFFSTRGRAGDTGKGLVVVEGIDTIDASRSDTDIAGHAGNGRGGGILADLALLLGEGVEPRRRPGMAAAGEGRRVWWVYEEPAKAAVAAGRGSAGAD